MFPNDNHVLDSFQTERPVSFGLCLAAVFYMSFPCKPPVGDRPPSRGPNKRHMQVASPMRKTKAALPLSSHFGFPRRGVGQLDPLSSDTKATEACEFQMRSHAKDTERAVEFDLMPNLGVAVHVTCPAWARAAEFAVNTSRVVPSKRSPATLTPPKPLVPMCLFPVSSSLPLGS